MKNAFPPGESAMPEAWPDRTRRAMARSVLPGLKALLLAGSTLWAVLYALGRPLRSGQCHAPLTLILTAAVFVAGLADFIGLEEKHLCDSLVGVDLGGQGGRV